MSRVFFISDLHLGHKSICKFAGKERGGVTTVDEHDAWIVQQWNSTVTKRDLVWVLGDVCFDRSKLPLLKAMNGAKHLILGNHDEFPLKEYEKYFNKIHGFMKYKGVWLSHAPIAVLRGKYNVHGHMHHNSMDNPMYINVSVEQSNGVPQLWDDLLVKMRGVADETEV